MIKYKIVLLYIFCIGFFIEGMGQDNPSHWIDVVYLRDGSVLKGRILEYDYETEMRFEFSTGAQVVLAHSKIRSIRQELLNKGRVQKTYQFKERGFYNATDLIILAVDERTDDQAAAGLSSSFGFQFRRSIGAGIGFAVHNFSIGGNEMIYALYGEARGYLNKKNVSPFYAAHAGYGFAANDDQLVSSRGGIYLAPSFGYRMGAAEHVNFTLSLGWNFQRASFTYRGNNWINETIEQRIQYKRFFVKAGLLF